LEETERARAIYKIAIERANIDMPESVWKSYIDMEIRMKAYDNVRNLYK
jgi:crooked neck